MVYRCNDQARKSTLYILATAFPAFQAAYYRACLSQMPYHSIQTIPINMAQFIAKRVNIT